MIRCKEKTNSFLGSHYVEVMTAMSLDYPNPNTYFVPLSCQHCEKPSCLAACPKEVFSKREDGIVAVGNTSACESCGDKPCIRACPYNAIDLDPKTGRIGKCDMCADRVDKGEVPACAVGCLTHSILFGDFDDPDSVVSQTVASWTEVGYDHQLKPETKNGPTHHYLLSKKDWQEMETFYSPAWHNE
jgi:Fe-S-cluster-containing dehydrogenase component